MSETKTRPAAERPALQVIEPNTYSLEGSGLHVSFSTTGIDGQPHFDYQDAQRTLNFRGDAIRIVPVPDLGMVVSVTLTLTIDSGSTTFSLLIPRVNLPAPFSTMPIRTDGITAHHVFSIVPALNLGQRDFYKVVALHGTATRVDF